MQFCFAIFFLVSPVFLPILKLVFGHIARYAPSNKLQNSLKIQTKNCTSYYFTIAKQELSRTKEDFIVDHFAKYDTPDVPPVWKTLEVTSFGTLSKLFCNLSDNALKKTIAREFDLPQHKIFESWIKSAVALRNCLAHHSRVWNRVFPIKPQMPTKLKVKWIATAVPQANKLYPQLCCLQYILNVMCPCNDFSSQLKNLLKQHPNIDVSAMGFPANWQNEPLWK